MNIEFIALENQKNVIEGIILHKLIVRRDRRGILVETLKENWEDVFNRPELQLGQSYYSITYSGFARDENLWHVHPNQADRFVVAGGNAVFALFDSRNDSKTHGTLNLFLIGKSNGDGNQYLLFIPPRVLHSFAPVGNEPCLLLGYPTHSYNREEEGRIPFAEVHTTFSDGTPFSWKTIRDHFNNQSGV